MLLQIQGLFAVAAWLAVSMLRSASTPAGIAGCGDLEPAAWHNAPDSSLLSGKVA